MRRVIIHCLILISTFCGAELFGQGYYFGPRGGAVLGFQNGNDAARQPLISYHGDIFIESLDPQKKGSLFGMIGYHSRGSAIRGTLFNTGNAFTTKFLFKNISLCVGAKRKIGDSDGLQPYYMVGLRVEYTYDTNLNDNTNSVQSIYFPIHELTNKLNYGLTAGGGFELPLSEFVIPYIEFTLNPDLSFQYRSDAIPNVTHPYTGNLVTIPEREIRNLSIEISIGFKFLRKVIYQ